MISQLNERGHTMKYLTMSQLQEKLGGRGRTTIYRDVENERLPKPLKLGSRLYWVESAVDDAIASAQPQAA
jgi:prophage regulatory protein